MKNYLLVPFLFLLPLLASAQSYEDSLFDYRENYVNSLIAGKPGMTAAEASYIRFYKPDKDYCAKGVFIQDYGSKPFLMKTKHGGISPSVRDYGYIYFNLKGASVKLYVYQLLSEDDKTGPPHLFIPFTDATNYKETFCGGRYLDMSAEELQNNNSVLIDFNKCYNPHTAYEKGYPYIVPPVANNLRIDIKAGEKIFGHNPGY